MTIIIKKNVLLQGRRKGSKKCNIRKTKITKNDQSVYRGDIWDSEVVGQR